MKEEGRAGLQRKERKTEGIFRKEERKGERQGMPRK